MCLPCSKPCLGCFTSIITESLQWCFDVGHTSILHTDYWGLDRLSVPCHPVRKKKGQAMFHSKVCNFHLKTSTWTSGVSIYKFGKNKMHGIIRVHGESWLTSLINFQSDLLISPNFENQTTSPNTQHSPSSWNFVREYWWQMFLKLQKKKKPQFPLVASQIMEAFMWVWASLQLFLGFLLGFLHFWIVSF